MWCFAQVEFEKPDMTVDALIEYGRCVVDEQENVQRVQLAESYLSGAELAGIDGKSIPDELVQRIKQRKQTAEEKELVACWARCPSLVPATFSVLFVAEQLLNFESSIVFA